ncbi:MAG: GspMb/PilO family protein [Pseudohongiella sp.]|nr:GspMb/PilO family protein [Pseudohongiella sp.]MDO9520947.1 GspMb/PilO family protein [Pseudohongiella sp.]
MMVNRLYGRFAGARHLTSREKLILRLALLVAVIMLLVNGVPAVTSYYRSQALLLETFRADIEREQRLIDDAVLWQQRRETAGQQVRMLDNSLFTGGSVALLTAAIQRQVRQIATEAGLSINSANLAETQQSGDWILVEQALSFSTSDQSSILVFMQRLADTQPLLKVTRFSMRPNRNQYIGELTVVGFSRSGTAAVTARRTP